MAGDINLHERVTKVEANLSSMKESLGTLNTSINILNDKLDTVTNKISTAAGIFAAVIFFCEFIVIPVIFIVFRKQIGQ